MKQVPHRQVELVSGFWAERAKVNREVTLPIEYEQCKSTGRIDAFKLDWKPGKPNEPHCFWDSDVAKWIEAVSYSLATHPDKALERKLNGVIDLIAKAQRPDGYLNVYFTAVKPKERWTNLRDMHELYTAGHMMEAAVAHYEATGSTKLLDVLCRFADYIDSVFGREKGKLRGYPGHQEIELALIKLYRTTGNSKYRDLAEFFVNERGRQPHYYDKEAKARGANQRYRWGEYDNIQAHLPAREQKTAEGHAVRAAYFYAGMADVAAETGDRAILKACRALWQNITEKRMYIHGGIGSTLAGERFTFDYDLPNETAYAETCASIALVFFAHRMLQLDLDSKYSDVMERCLYNGIISGVSQDGSRFFYDNVLGAYPGAHRFRNQKPPQRQEWFGCACCPPNIARLLASIGGYIYTQSKSVLAVNLFVESRASIEIAGANVAVTQRTGYPWKGSVQVSVTPSQPKEFTIALRVPCWCRKASFKLNGKAMPRSASVRKGYLHIRRTWTKGDRISIDLPMPVERIEAHPSLRQDCGRIALQRGPILYCLEARDNGKDLNDIILPSSSKLIVKTGKTGLFSGIPLITGTALRRDTSSWKGKLYSPETTRLVSSRITAIPYFMWANRGLGEMIAWILSD